LRDTRDRAAWRGGGPEKRDQLLVELDGTAALISPRRTAMDHDTLYETDICTWAEQQAAALRGFASRVDLPNELDLANIVEEIEDVGNSHFRAVTSFMRLILSHTILIALNADTGSVRHWTFEVFTFRGNLIQAWQRSMRQRIDLDLIWRHAVREAAQKMTLYRESGTAPGDDKVMARLESDCPFGIDDLCGDAFEFHDMVNRLRAHLAPDGSL